MHTALSNEILAAVPYALFVLDDQERLVFANPRFVTMFSQVVGVAPVVGHSLTSQLPEAGCRQAFMDSLQNPEDPRPICEIEIDGQVRYIEWQLHALASPEGYTLVQLEDVTGRIRAERRAAAAQDALRETMRVRDTILSIIGHDLRAPIAQLNAILFFLRRSPGTLNANKLEAYSVELEDMTRHLSNALDNLLQWSTSHRRGLEPEWTHIAPAEVLRESLGLLQPLAVHKQITLDLEDVLTSLLETDRDMLAFIVRNLVANAIKFSRPQSTIRIWQGIEDGAYKLRVIDTGVGMNPEQIAKIEAAEQFISTRGTGGERGIGLGLKLCLEFAGKLSGRLKFCSTPDAGTTVCLTLPLRRAEPNWAETEEEAGEA